MAKNTRAGRPKAAGGKAPAKRARQKLMPYELLLRVARGEPIDGRRPTLAQRIAAAKQALPYHKARLAPQPADKKEDEPFVVRVIRFGDLAKERARNASREVTRRDR